MGLDNPSFWENISATGGLAKVNKQNLYVSLINTLIGISFSLLLKGNVLICVLAFIILITILFIERQWLYEKIFRRKKWFAVAGYGAVAFIMVITLVIFTKSSRDTSVIVKNVNLYFDNIKAGDCQSAYDRLSNVSKKAYSLNDFVADHSSNRMKIQDFRVDDVIFNRYDDKKAVVTISSPFLIYGQGTLPLEVVREDEGWRIVLSEAIVENRIPSKETKKGGAVSKFFKKIF